MKYVLNAKGCAVYVKMYWRTSFHYTYNRYRVTTMLTYWLYTAKPFAMERYVMRIYVKDKHNMIIIINSTAVLHTYKILLIRITTKIYCLGDGNEIFTNSFC